MFNIYLVRLILMASAAILSSYCIAAAQDENATADSISDVIAAAVADPKVGQESTAVDSDIRNSVVQISSTLRLPNYLQPWNKRSSTVTGTGTILKGGRVLTNAHVVMFASQIYVQGFQGAERVEAKPLFIAPNIDLALLQIEDEEFYAKRPSLEISPQLPLNGQSVKVYGYPIGGSDLSTTEGVVSRIELAPMFNGAMALRIQVDAAVNPGNSGGPAISDGRMIGVVFSKAKQAESTGYLIAGEEVVAFLQDIEDGSYDGRPQWMHSFQSLENESLREFHGLNKDTGGVLIKQIHGDEEKSALKVGDIVTSIQGQPISKDGKATVTDSLRLPFFYFVPKSSKAAAISLEVIRDGKTQAIEIAMDTELSRVIGYEPHYPRYFLCGPIVFTQATSGLVNSFPPQLVTPMLHRFSPLLLRIADSPSFDGEELVTISSNPFASPLMKGYNSPTLATLTTINGEAVKNLEHAAQLVHNCKAEFIRFEFADRGVDSLVFRRAALEAATEAVLQDNGIRSQYSDDLRAVFEAEQN